LGTVVSQVLGGEKGDLTRAHEVAGSDLDAGAGLHHEAAGLPLAPEALELKLFAAMVGSTPSYVSFAT
jgi:hypothetical protein